MQSPSPALSIRRVAPGDAADLIALDRALADRGAGMVISVEQVRTVESETRRIEDLLLLPAKDATTIVVAESPAGRVVGSAELRQLSPMRCRHVGILSMGVHPNAQRRGLGRKLMQSLIEHANEHGLLRLELYVRADNVAAQELYRSFGFLHEATRESFIRLDDGTFIDDWIFARMLGRAG